MCHYKIDHSYENAFSLISLLKLLKILLDQKKMCTNNKIEVLSRLRLLLKLTNLCNRNGVHIGSVKIPDFFVFSLISSSLFYISLLLFWIAIEKNLNLKLVSINVAATIGFTQMAITYISLAAKSNLIVSTVDYLQKVVERSK